MLKLDVRTLSISLTAISFHESWMSKKKIRNFGHVSRQVKGWKESTAIWSLVGMRDIPGWWQWKEPKFPGNRGRGKETGWQTRRFVFHQLFCWVDDHLESIHSDRCIAQVQSIFHSWVAVCSSRKHVVSRGQNWLFNQAGAVFENFLVMDLVCQMLCIPGISCQEFTFQTDARTLKIMMGGNGTASGLQNKPRTSTTSLNHFFCNKLFNWFNPNLKSSNSQLGISLNPIGKQEPALVLI